MPLLHVGQQINGEALAAGAVLEPAMPVAVTKPPQERNRIGSATPASAR